MLPLEWISFSTWKVMLATFAWYLDQVPAAKRALYSVLCPWWIPDLYQRQVKLEQIPLVVWKHLLTV